MKRISAGLPLTVTLGKSLPPSVSSPQKGQENLSRIGSEERLSLRGSLAWGEPPGAVKTLLPQLSHPHPIPVPKP